VGLYDVVEKRMLKQTQLATSDNVSNRQLNPDEPGKVAGYKSRRI
jgi:hypothetical protein